jgi:unsaturated rhamnogalacturonyl hydrolase
VYPMKWSSRERGMMSVSMRVRGVRAIAGALAASVLAAALTHAAEARSAASVLKEGSRVADWQLSHMGNFDYIPAGSHRTSTEGSRDWIQAAFYIGLTQFADVVQNSHYVEALLAHGQAEGWGFDTRPRHADSDATAAVWIWAAQHTHDLTKLTLTKARFDAVLADPSSASLAFVQDPPGGTQPCQARWCWCDAIFMAPPAWMALTRVTGDTRYLAHADSEFWATKDYLYDPAEHLFYRDSRFFDQRDAGGRKIFWGRGNGWVFAGLARILTELPPDHPDRSRYEALFKEMAAKLVSLQGHKGYWPASLLEPQEVPETSGTGFFVYGLAWGVNHGLLPARQYRSSIQRGWRALAVAVQPDGKLGWVQRIGAAPDQVSATDTQLYGSGAFLLAASEVSRMP